MDPKWLVRHLRTSWSHGAGFADACRLMLLLYARSLPDALRRPCWTIDFRYPPPVGTVRLALRDNLGADVFVWSEVFEQRVYELPLAAAPSTILDLGSHIGLAAIYFARRYPGAAIACVEPEPGNLAMLRRNLALNDVAPTVFAGAAHSDDGPVHMEPSEAYHGHAVIQPATPGGCGFGTTAFSVPTVAARMGWERIGLAKIDIEGHETVLLSERCDWLHRVDALCIEYHVDGAVAHLGEIARRYGFLPPRPVPGGLWLLTRS